MKAYIGNVDWADEGDVFFFSVESEDYMFAYPINRWSLAYPTEDSKWTNRFQMFATKNMWNFIKLDTQTGKMWMVQFSVEDSNDRFVYDLNPLYLYFNDDMVNGRFELYPTQNSWNFILLDQIDGRTWQVQWSFESEKCFIIPLEILDDNSDETSDETLDKPSDSIEE